MFGLRLLIAPITSANVSVDRLLTRHRDEHLLALDVLVDKPDLC
jgi:hypothetical protein